MSGIQAVAQRLFGERDGSAWPSRRRVCAYAALLLGLEVIGLAFFVAGTHG